MEIVAESKPVLEKFVEDCGASKPSEEAVRLMKMCKLVSLA